MIKTTVICGGGCGTTEELLRPGFYDRQKYPDDWYGVRIMSHSFRDKPEQYLEVIPGFVLVCPKCVLGFVVEQLGDPMAKMENGWEMKVEIRKGDY